MTTGIELTTRLQYSFQDSKLLSLALTHRSKSASNYERLEFLGDSILNFIVAEALYERFPDASEGVLSRLRADLVCKETLAQVSRKLSIGSHVVLGGGELKSGGFNRDSILADSFEAIVGAVYKDGGLTEVRRFVTCHLSEELESANPSAVNKDPKSKLQEFLQKRSLDLPGYSVIGVSGEPHCQRFVVECIVQAIPESFQGEGTSRRSAEQEAAEKAYRYLTATDD